MSECERPSSPSVPIQCAQQFQRIEHRLTGIETRLDALLSSRATWAARLWSLTKAAVLMIVGYVLGSHK